MIEQSNRIIKYLFTIHIFLFIFIMYNREFRPFGIDLRYILILFSGILVLYVGIKIFLKIKEVRNFRNLFKILIEKIKQYPLFVWFVLLFYLNMIISNIMWLFNGLIYHPYDFKNNIILNVTNLLIILIIYLFNNLLNNKVIKYSVVIAHTVLLISMLLVWSGYSLNQIMGGDYPGYYGGLENYNFLGQNMRLAGYAQDPNYTSFFMVLSFFTGLYFIENKYAKYAMCLSAIFGLLLSASRTVTLGVLASLIFIFIWKKIKLKSKKYSIVLISLFVSAVAVVPYFVVKLAQIATLNFNLSTMSTRLSMWDTAVILFERSPIIGNGLTSFRSFFEASGGWYAQAHSTILQIMSENGIIGLVLFTIIFILIMKSNGEYKQYLCFIFLVFSLTSELVYLAIFPFIVALVPMLNLNKGVNEELYK